jgi:hypothetical protein
MKSFIKVSAKNHHGRTMMNIDRYTLIIEEDWSYPNFFLTLTPLPRKCLQESFLEKKEEDNGK